MIDNKKQNELIDYYQFGGRVRLLFEPNETLSTQWGAVLSAGFDMNAADVLCRGIGYDLEAINITVINAKNMNDADMEIYKDSFNSTEYIAVTMFDCIGTEETLWDCNNTLPSNATRFDIKIHETVAVNC